MGRVLAVANQKGGVAKTTTTHSLGDGLAELGERVLLVDLVLANLEERYGLPVLGEPIPKSVRFAEAPGQGRSILTHAPRSAGAEGYRAIVRILHSELS